MGCIVQFVFVVGLFELVTKVNQFVFVVDGRNFCFSWYGHFNYYSVHFMLGCTDQVLIHHCRMAHPTYPLLETFYHSKHRAHVLVDQGEVSLWTSIDTIIHFHCNSLIILYLCFFVL